MGDKLSIRVNVADRYYPLKVNREDEEDIRRAARIINEKIIQYKQRYTDKDTQDFLAMASLQFVNQLIALQQESSGEEMLESISELNKMIGSLLDEENRDVL
ncbi:MAG: cell division protein ZapA [Bacteroidales bacterium]|nr:cell division protein ZapA [Bacteroidales bacterium]